MTRYEIRFAGLWKGAPDIEETYSWTDDISVVAWIRGFLKFACPQDYDRKFWRHTRTIDHIAGRDVPDDELPPINQSHRWDW